MTTNRGAERLLRLYPRAWRARYGDELLATIGDARLHPQQAIDLLAGAADAWLSRDVRRAVASQDLAGTGTHRGGSMIRTLRACRDREMRYSMRDALIGAVVILAVTFLLLWVADAAERRGWEDLASAVVGLSMPVALQLSLPLWLLKGQSRKVKLLFTVGPLLLLIGIGYLSTLI